MSYLTNPYRYVVAQTTWEQPLTNTTYPIRSNNGYLNGQRIDNTNNAIYGLSGAISATVYGVALARGSGDSSEMICGVWSVPTASDDYAVPDVQQIGSAKSLASLPTSIGAITFTDTLSSSLAVNNFIGFCWDEDGSGSCSGSNYNQCYLNNYTGAATNSTWYKNVCGGTADPDDTPDSLQFTITVG